MYIYIYIYICIAFWKIRISSGQISIVGTSPWTNLHHGSRTGQSASPMEQYPSWTNLDSEAPSRKWARPLGDLNIHQGHFETTTRDATRRNATRRSATRRDAIRHETCCIALHYVASNRTARHRVVLTPDAHTHIHLSPLQTQVGGMSREVLVNVAQSCYGRPRKPALRVRLPSNVASCIIVTSNIV